MMLEPHFTEDVSDLPNDMFGPGSLTWWGTIAFMVIEGAGFGLAIAAYFFLMNQEQTWPPAPFKDPNLLAGTLFTLVVLLSEIPNTMARKAAQAEDTEKARKIILVMAVIGFVLMIIRAFEFQSLNIHWYENAYGSIVWALLFLHTTHIMTDWADTLVLAALIRTPLGYQKRRMIDLDENAMYWRFVWLMWLPIYVMIYWLPRWV